MTSLGPGCAIVGEIESQEDLTIDGRVHGTVWCEAHAVVIDRAAVMTGDVIADRITVHGNVTGDLIATRVVDIRASARVTGRIVSRGLVLEDGGMFTGTVEPQQLTAAVEVARFARRRAAAAPGSAPDAPAAELAR